MKKEYIKKITAIAEKFVNQHFHEINEIRYSKEELLDEIYVGDFDTISWIVMELMRWGCDKNYQTKYFYSNIDNNIQIKIDNVIFGYSGENFKIKVIKKDDTI